MKSLNQFINESSEVNEKLDMNDPMLIALRARKSKDLKNAKKIAEMKKKRVYGKQRERLESDLEDIRSELSSLYSDRASTLDEMESEAGSKGSSWTDDDANRYGTELNKIESSIEKLIKKRSDIETKLSY